MPVGTSIVAVILMDPTLTNGSDTNGNPIPIALPSGGGVKVYDTAYDDINILPGNQQLDEDLRNRWPNEQSPHQALAKDNVVKDDAIAFIEARLINQ